MSSGAASERYAQSPRLAVLPTGARLVLPTVLNRVYLPYQSGDIVAVCLRQGPNMTLGYAMREGLARRLEVLRELSA